MGKMFFPQYRKGRKEGINLICIKLEKTDTQNCFSGHLLSFFRTPNIFFPDTYYRFSGHRILK